MSERSPSIAGVSFVARCGPRSRTGSGRWRGRTFLTILGRRCAPRGRRPPSPRGLSVGFRASSPRPPAALAGRASDALSFGRAAGGGADAVSPRARGQRAGAGTQERALDFLGSDPGGASRTERRRPAPPPLLRRSGLRRKPSDRLKDGAHRCFGSHRQNETPAPRRWRAACGRRPINSAPTPV